MKCSTKIISIFLIILFINSQCTRTEANQNIDEPSFETKSCAMNVDGTCIESIKNPSSSSSSQYKFPGCRLFLAPSTIQSPNAGYGIFITRSLKRGQPITFADIILQVNDYLDKYGNNKIGPLIQQYSWNAQSFGGHYEGESNIASVLPGIGSLANAQTTFTQANALPYRPDVDEANVPRTDSAGAGSFTHYHNLTFFATRDVSEGSEIFVYYDLKNDGNWWKMMTNTTKYDQITNIPKQQQKHQYPKRDVNWLNQNGYCIDNIQVSKSKIKGAGRGAFATKFIPRGSIVSPLPLVVIPNNEALQVHVAKKKKTSKNKMTINNQQLILNYCFGHPNSSLLFFPTGPGVNLINHAPTKINQIDEESIGDGNNSKKNDNNKNNKKKAPPIANVKLQWSSTTSNYPTNPTQLSLEEIKQNPQAVSSKLMMEYVATRDIQPKEEILLDYGHDWVQAWTKHEKSWEAPPNAKAYSPSYVMEDVAGLLRTEKEQVDYPYPSNLDISCFYQYSIFHEKKNSGIMSSSSSSSSTTTVKWQMDRKTFEFKNLRPCNVMSREKVGDGHWIYTVQMKNRPGLPKKEMIPNGELHVVTHIPRGAIRFTDRIHSTDQHLPNAFRHEIGIPDEIFPQHWMDLNED